MHLPPRRRTHIFSLGRLGQPFSIYGITWVLDGDGRSGSVVIALGGGKGSDTGACSTSEWWFQKDKADVLRLYGNANHPCLRFGDGSGLWIAKATQWCRKKYSKVFLSGFSAGANVTALYLCTGFSKKYPVDGVLIAGIMDTGFSKQFMGSWGVIEVPIIIAKGKDVPRAIDVSDQFYRRISSKEKTLTDYNSRHDTRDMWDSCGSDFLRWVSKREAYLKALSKRRRTKLRSRRLRMRSRRSRIS